MNLFGYLFAGYSIIFAVIFFYVLFIWRRQIRLEADLKVIETRLDALRENASAAAAPQSRSAP
jgi:CcmD family protein